MKRAILIGAAILVLGACAAWKPLTPDQRLSKEIIGSWIVAGDSSDYRPIPMHERFFGDGTYWIFWFSNASCSKIIGETHLEWKIKNGVLISKVTKVTSPAFGHIGDVIKSRIVSLTKDRMVLHSLNDGSTYARVRSTRCLAPKLTKT